MHLYILRSISILCGILTVPFMPVMASDNANQITVYSFRKPELIKPLSDAFTKQSGVSVKIIFANKPLTRRLIKNDNQTPADVILAEDITRVKRLQDSGLLQPIRSEIIEANIPPYLRSPGGKWFGLTTRARGAVVSRERVGSGSITSVNDLANPKYKGRICMRSFYHPYNIALTASKIAKEGLDAAEDWVNGIKTNLARMPQGDDPDQVFAIHKGECDIALVNSYFLGQMLSAPKGSEQRTAADSVQMVFLDQKSKGQHINISAAAIATTSTNPEHGIKFIEFLSGIDGQKLYTDLNYEYPANTMVPLSQMLKSWGPFKADDISLHQIAIHRDQALFLINDLGF